MAMVMFSALAPTTPASRQAHVLRDRLAVLADRWTLHPVTAPTRSCASRRPAGSVMALGYYSMPGVPTLTLTADELAGGTWALVR